MNCQIVGNTENSSNREGRMELQFVIIFEVCMDWALSRVALQARIHCNHFRKKQTKQLTISPLTAETASYYRDHNEMAVWNRRS